MREHDNFTAIGQDIEDVGLVTTRPSVSVANEFKEVDYEPIKRLMETPSESESCKEHCFIQTGIKAIDILTPVSVNGSIMLKTAWGDGPTTLLEEFIHALRVGYKGRAVILTVKEKSKGTSFHHKVRREQAHYQKLGLLDTITALLVPNDASDEVRRNAVERGLAMVYDLLQTEDRVVLFAIDQLLLTSDMWAAVKRFSSAVLGSMLTVVSGYDRDYSGQQSTPIETDVFITLQPGLFGIDFSRSTSAFLDPDVLGEEHVRLSHEVREMIQAAKELIPNDDYSEEVLEGFSPESRQLVERARRLKYFLMQPFYSKQMLLGIPGERVSLKDTLDGFKAILDGQYDHLPLEAFDYTGTIDQVVVKAEKA